MTTSAVKVEVVNFAIKVDVSCGEWTCASDPGVFCKQLGSRNFGQKPVCLHFGVDLDVRDGWTQRCAQCSKAEEESK